MVRLNPRPETKKAQDFARVVRTHRRALTRYGLRRLDNAELVEDLVAETFLVLWRNWDQLPNRDEELFLLYGIARRAMSNMNRSELRRESLHARLSLERMQEADTPQFAKSDIDHLIEAMGALSDDDQEIVRLKYWERVSYREIGIALNCSENSVGLRLSRIKASIHRHFLEPASAVEMERRSEK